MSYRIPTEQLAKEPESNSSLYTIIPRHRCQIKPLDIGHWSTWMVFGNDDDGIFGEGEHAHYKVDWSPDLKKATFWWCRNPLHNFCFYVIGSAHRENSHYELIKIGPPIALEVSLNGGKPFIQLDLHWTCSKFTTFYAGWRERGNFGLKFKPISRMKVSPCSDVPQ